MSDYLQIIKDTLPPWLSDTTTNHQIIILDQKIDKEWNNLILFLGMI